MFFHKYFTTHDQKCSLGQKGDGGDSPYLHIQCLWSIIPANKGEYSKALK